MGARRRAWSLLPCGLLVACASARAPRAFPWPPAAAEALAEARTLERLRPSGWFDRAEAAAREAELEAPAWVAPRRFQDELARARWDAHSALAARRAALADGADAGELYLVARLEGRGARATMERAAAVDPGLAWAHHGLAWHLADAGDPRAARRAAAQASALAAGSYELGAFALARARIEFDQDKVEAARALLGEALARPELVEPERTELSVWLALAEMRSSDLDLVTRGLYRGAELLAAGALSAQEYQRLGDELLEARVRGLHDDPCSLWLAALAAEGPAGTRAARERLRVRLLLERGEHELATVLAAAAPGGLAAGRFQRVRDFERGAAAEALERWRAALPAGLCDESGLPRLAPLRALVSAARAPEEPGKAVRVGEALLAAGWFEEAQGHAAALAPIDLEAALDLHARAAQGRALLVGVRALLEAIDRDERVSFPNAEEPRSLDSLDELLSAMGALFARVPALADARLADSPRLDFAGLAAVVHPGPDFSAADEREGLGRAGEAVPGLARALAALNRFGLFGQAPGGGGPDGTVLRRIGLEWKEGQRLGVPFAGLVAWCEGADVPSRPVRAGAAVSAAALHEGYWIDVESVRADHAGVVALVDELVALPAEARARMLAGRGPELEPGADAREAARFLEPLGEGERVLLAVLSERTTPLVTLEELLAHTALHEEGHLTERARFLPLARRWPAVLAFALRHGLTPSALARALEYRAQLVALCEAEDPRLVLADCLFSAGEGGGTLQHGPAYRELVADLLAELVARAAEFPGFERGHYALYQLHTLTRGEVRRLALSLARREGLWAEGYEPPVRAGE